MAPAHLDPRRLRHARIASGLRPSELSREADISYAYWYRLERGLAANPTTGALTRIAAALGVSVGDLFSDTDEQVGA